jgi:polar amino acid transport system permease protein
MRTPVSIGRPVAALPTEGSVLASRSQPTAIDAVPLRHWGRWISACVVVFLLLALLWSLWHNPRVNISYVGQTLFAPFVLRGVVVTIELTIISMIIGIAGGVLFAVMRLSKNFVLSVVAWLYIWFFRGTPILVQIIFWGFFGALYPKLFLGVPFTGLVFGSADTGRLYGAFVAAILGLGLNEAAYAAELVRAGIIAVDKGQEAQCMRLIVLPQAMRVITPALGNDTISMLKTTALVSVISGADLLTNVQQAYSQNFQTIPLLLVASIWYLFLTSIMSIGQHYIEAYYGRGFGKAEAKVGGRKRRGRDRRRATAATRTCGDHD